MNSPSPWTHAQNLLIILNRMTTLFIFCGTNYYNQYNKTLFKNVLCFNFFKALLRTGQVCLINSIWVILIKEDVTSSWSSFQNWNKIKFLKSWLIKPTPTKLQHIIIVEHFAGIVFLYLDKKQIKLIWCSEFLIFNLNGRTLLVNYYKEIKRS